MHTVKSKESISSAYFDYGVKSFSLDNKDELRKILEATNQAKDLKLFVELQSLMNMPKLTYQENLELYLLRL